VGDAAALFRTCKQTFAVVAIAVQFSIVRSLDFAVALGRNHGLAPLSMDLLQHTIAIIALVVDDVFCRQTLQESRGLRDVVCLARRQQKLYRVAGIVTGRVNLRSESAARPAEFPVPVFMRASAA